MRIISLEMAMKPKIAFFIKIQLKKFFWTKGTKTTKKKDQILFVQNHCKVDGPSIPEIIKIQPFHHKLWKNLFSEVGQCNFTAAKKAFFTISWHKPVFLPWKWQTTMTNNLHHVKPGIKTFFFSLGLGIINFKSLG